MAVVRLAITVVMVVLSVAMVGSRWWLTVVNGGQCGCWWLSFVSGGG